jgi:hypothetical protein
MVRLLDFSRMKQPSKVLLVIIISCLLFSTLFYIVKYIEDFMGCSSQFIIATTPVCGFLINCKLFITNGIKQILFICLRI